MHILVLLCLKKLLLWDTKIPPNICKWVSLIMFPTLTTYKLVMVPVKFGIYTHLFQWSTPNCSFLSIHLSGTCLLRRSTFLCQNIFLINLFSRMLSDTFFYIWFRPNLYAPAPFAIAYNNLSRIYPCHKVS